MKEAIRRWKALGGMLSMVAALASVAAVAGPATSTRGVSVGNGVGNFALLDTRGKLHELNRLDAKAVVVLSYAEGCPVARDVLAKLVQRRKSDPRFASVAVWVIGSVAGQNAQRLEREVRRAGAEFPVLLDDSQNVARLLGIQRTGAVVLVDRNGNRLVFRGPLDDQVSESGRKPRATRQYLNQALDPVLAGATVVTRDLPQRGCVLDFAESSPTAKPIRYSRDIAPLIGRKCVPCHRDDTAAPFVLASYQDVFRRRGMIREVVLARTMPPWHADPAHGVFAQNLSMNLKEQATLVRWVLEGARKAPGESDPLPSVYAKQKQTPGDSDWPFGKPDYVISMPETMKVPSSGFLDYQHYKIKAPFDRDVWIGAIAFKPSNRSVVHHINLYVNYPGVKKLDFGEGQYLWGWAPGEIPMPFLKDAGFFLPRGAEFDLEMHYNPTGREESDRTEVGFYLLDKKPATPLDVYLVVNDKIRIPANQQNVEVAASRTFPRETVLYSLCPHMHLRGRSFQVEAQYPDGRSETLLSVPGFDFGWQRTYYLKTPKTLPAGTVIRCTGTFDNSRWNPVNPDPDKDVRWGPQSHDEMFVFFGHFRSIGPF